MAQPPDRARPSSLFDRLEPRVLFAGNVRAFLDGGGNLIVIGDGAANCVQLDMFGDFTVLGCDHGGAPTSVNGEPNGEARFDVDGEGDIRFYMLGGDDEVRVGQRSDSVSPPDDLEVYAGEGDDYVLTVGDTNVGDDLEIVAGPGDDTVEVFTTQVGDDVSVLTGDGDDDVTLYGDEVGDDLVLHTGAGRDSVRVGFFDDPAGGPPVIEATRVADDTFIDLGADDDSLRVLRSTFRGTFWADAGRGTDTLEQRENTFGGRRIFFRFERRIL